jgi:hypothetical protein
VPPDGARDESIVDPLHEAEGLTLIALHEAGISHHVKRDYRNQTPVGLYHSILCFCCKPRLYSTASPCGERRASTAA